MQVIRDEFSGWIRAFPVTQRDADTVAGNLLEYLGPAYNQPHIMVKSDNAREVIAAAKQLHFTHEATLENRFPHNSVLERDIRTVVAGATVRNKPSIAATNSVIIHPSGQLHPVGYRSTTQGLLDSDDSCDIWHWD